MAPPDSLPDTVQASAVVAILKIEAVKTVGRNAFATAIVLRSLKGTAAGKRLVIQTDANLAETARYEAGEECLAFLAKRGERYETPLRMFGRYVVRDGKVLRWIIGRKRPENASLKSVIAEISAALR